VIYKITYAGKWLSLNEVYSKHRYLANLAKKEWKERFASLFRDAGVTPFSTFYISIKYWSRIDVDNNAGASKVGVDTLRELGLVANDDKRFYKGLTILPMPDMKHNTYLVTLYTDDDCSEVLRKISEIM
jgi:hypothetical protein